MGLTEYIFEKLQKSSKPIVLYGMGNGADLIISRLAHYGLKPAGIFASDGFVRAKSFHGLTVTDYQTAKAQFGNMTVLVCFGTDRAEVRQNIEKIAAENELYIPDVPVYGQDFFERDFVTQNKKKIEKVYGLLADSVSKHCFEQLISFKITAERHRLLQCESSPLVAEKELLNYSDEEVFLDLGAYNGDTVLQFAAATQSHYAHIIAAEPFSKNFQKLQQNTKHLKNITYFNKACSNSETPLLFNKKGGRGSSTGNRVTVPAFTVDSLLENFRVTAVKMDIEGFEKQALEGAAKTLQTLRPKLQIAAYHRSGDLFEIPLQVAKIQPNYKIYLRHFPCYPAWDTNYYFI